MIVERLDQLPDLSGEDLVFFDTETTSFSDNEPAFHPYLGHRVVGIGINTPDPNCEGWYLPLRHIEGANNLPYEGAIAWLKALAARSRTWVGHNVKFDAKFLAVDGILLQGDLECTVVLARLNDCLLRSAALGALSAQFLEPEFRKDDREVNIELKNRKTEDRARVPIDILGKYCLKDVIATRALRELLLKKLPAESAKIWKIEKGMTRVLLESEMRGFYVPKRPLQEFTRVRLWRMLELQEKLNEHAGEHVDALSNAELTRILEGLCVRPTTFTKKDGKPSWDSETLKGYCTPFTDMLAEYKEVSSEFSNFGEGWLKRLAPDETIHPNYRQAGTKTGRLASEDPNTQNLSKLAKAQVCPRPGHAFLSCDYCLTGDQVIKTEYGPMTIKAIVESADPIRVLSSRDGKSLEFQPVERRAMVGAAEIWEVGLEDGSVLRCTSDHKWMGYEGEHILTKDLAVGTRLAHLHQTIAPYPVWSIRGWKRYAHAFVAEQLLGPVLDTSHVHHIDGNKQNYAVNNLQVLKKEAHFLLESKIQWARMDNTKKEKKVNELNEGRVFNRRSYAGEGNPNWGKKRPGIGGRPFLQIEVNCASCGKVILRKQHAVLAVQKTSRPFYCSRDCYHKCHANKHLKRVVCSICGGFYNEGRDFEGPFICGIRCAVGGNHKVAWIKNTGLVENIYQLTVKDTHAYVLDCGAISLNSQIEFRIFSHYCNSPQIIKRYTEDVKADYHQSTADMLGIPRDPAKRLNFGMIYGMGKDKLTGILTVFVKQVCKTEGNKSRHCKTIVQGYLCILVLVVIQNRGERHRYGSTIHAVSANSGYCIDV